jgi:hypothetical protein
VYMAKAKVYSFITGKRTGAEYTPSLTELKPLEQRDHRTTSARMQDFLRTRTGHVVSSSLIALTLGAGVVVSALGFEKSDDSSASLAKHQPHEAVRQPYTLKPNEILLADPTNSPDGAWHVTGRATDDHDGVSTSVVCVGQHTIEASAGSSPISFAHSTLEGDTYQAAPLALEGGVDNPAAKYHPSVHGVRQSVYERLQLDEATKNRYASLLGTAIIGLNNGEFPKAGLSYETFDHCLVDELVSTGQ